MERGDIKVFKTGERYSPPLTGNFLEVAIKAAHPKVMPPATGTPPPPGNKILHDSPDFTVFAEKMQPGEYAAPHSHNVRLAIFLNDTTVQQWTDGKRKPGNWCLTLSPGDPRWFTHQKMLAQFRYAIS